MCAEIIDIKNVPPDPNTGLMPTKIYNPLGEEFWFKWDGIDYSIPAKSSKEFPEFMARHAAKHLAMKIVYQGYELKFKEEAIGQIAPDTAKVIPQMDVTNLTEALLKSETEALEAVGKVPGFVVTEATTVPSIEGMKIVQEEVPVEKELTTKEKRVEALKKARAAKVVKKRGRPKKET